MRPGPKVIRTTVSPVPRTPAVASAAIPARPAHQLHAAASAAVPEIGEVGNVGNRVIEEVGKVIVGKRNVMELVMVAFLTEGAHILFEDYPGLAKTLMAS